MEETRKITRATTIAKIATLVQNGFNGTIPLQIFWK